MKLWHVTKRRFRIEPVDANEPASVFVEVSNERYNELQQKLINGGVELDVVNGELVTVPIPTLSDEEQAAQDLQALRVARNKLLADSDWTQLPDAHVKNRFEWSEYRQALRDITQKYRSLEDVVWPKKPNEVTNGV